MAQTLHRFCRATLVALHCVVFFALRFRNFAQESRYTPESVSKKPLSHPLGGGGCRTSTLHCIDRKIVSPYRGCHFFRLFGCGFCPCPKHAHFNPNSSVGCCFAPPSMWNLRNYFLTIIRVAMPAEVRCVIFRWNFIWSLKSPVGKISWNFGEDFSTGQESTRNYGVNFAGKFGEHFGNFVSNFATFFFRKLRSAEGWCKKITFAVSADS